MTMRLLILQYFKKNITLVNTYIIIPVIFEGQYNIVYTT